MSSQLGRLRSQYSVHSYTGKGIALAGVELVQTTKHIGLAVSDGELAVAATAAQMRVAHRRAVFDIHLLMTNSFLIRKCRKVDGRGTNDGGL